MFALPTRALGQATSVSYRIDYHGLMAGGGQAASATFRNDASMSDLGGSGQGSSDRITSSGGFAGQLNEPPVVADRTLAVDHGGSVAITLSAVDPEGDAVSFEVVSGPGHGRLTGVPPSLVYAPETGFSGSDQFLFRARDSQGDSSQATVRIQVGAASPVPRAVAASLGVNEDESLPVTLQGVHPTGGALQFRIVSPPAHGSLSGVAPLLRYLPATNFAGTDQLSFVVSDGTRESEPAVVSFDVAPVNDPPEIAPMTPPVMGGGIESVQLRIALSDPDSAMNQITVVADSSNPALVLPSSLVVVGTGADRTLWVNFVSGASGTTTIRLEARDGAGGIGRREIELRRMTESRVPVTVAWGPTGLELRAVTSPGTYSIDASDDLVSWRFVEQVVTTTAELLWVDRSAARTGHRFYRLREGSDPGATILLTVARTPAGLDLTASVGPGNYRIEASSDLRTWSLLTRTTPSDGRIRYAAALSGEPRFQFYRVVREP